MKTKTVIALFVIGLCLLLIAFWAGLSVTRDSKAITTQEAAKTSNADNSTPARPGPQPARSAAEAALSNRFVVRVAAFGTMEQANQLTAELRRTYPSAYTQSPIAGEDSLYRVNIGPYDRNDAEQVATELGSKGRKGVMIVPSTRN